MAKRKRITNRSGGHRAASTYQSKDPEKRQRQLANLKKGSHRDRKPIKDSGPSIKDKCIEFAEKTFILPETKKPVKLLDFEKDIFKDLFEAEVRPTLALLGMPKKSGKSTIAAIVGLWYLLTKPFGEIYIMGPDLQQGQLVVFEKICKAIRLNPDLRRTCSAGKSQITCNTTFATITVLPCNKTAAGLNPDLVIFDELWQFTNTEAKRAIDEMTNVPEGIKHNLILVVTYAGFDSDEDTHLWRWYQQGIQQQEGKIEKDPKFYFLWRTNYEGIPWVTQQYLDLQRRRLRLNSYLRFHENQWTSSEEAFIDAITVESCTSKEHQRGQDYNHCVCAGLDIGVKHDCSALAIVGIKDRRKLCIVDHAVFKPVEGSTLNLERTIETQLEDWSEKYDIQAIYYDPYQAARSAQILTEAGLPMQEYPQTVSNLVAMAEGLQGLLKSGSLIMYPDDEIRRHLLSAAVKESSRGWRLVKQKQSKKIDLAVALAMACQAAIDILLAPAVEPVFEEVGTYYDFGKNYGKMF